MLILTITSPQSPMLFVHSLSTLAYTLAGYIFYRCHPENWLKRKLWLLLKKGDITCHIHIKEPQSKKLCGDLYVQHGVWLLIKKPLNLHQWKASMHQNSKQAGKQKWWHSLFLLSYFLCRPTLTQSFKQVVQSDKIWSGLHSQGRIWETLN